MRAMDKWIVESTSLDYGWLVLMLEVIGGEDLEIRV